MRLHMTYLVKGLELFQKYTHVHMARRAGLVHLEFAWNA